MLNKVSLRNDPQVPLYIINTFLANIVSLITHTNIPYTNST